MKSHFPKETITERPKKGLFRAVVSQAQNFVHAFGMQAAAFTSLVFTGEERMSIVRYDDVIPYFTSHRPNAAIALKGLLRITQEDGESPKLTQCFLDQNDQFITNERGQVVGRVIRFDEMAADLSQLFDGKTTIILS